MADDQWSPFLLGVVVGVLLGAVLAGAAGAWFLPADRSVDASSSMQTATGCSASPRAGGWVGVVPATDEAIVVFNYTVVHDAPAIDVHSELSEPVDGEYVFAISTTPAPDSGKGEPPEDCQPRTTLDAGVTLPRGFDALEVVLDGRSVTTVESGDASFRAVNGSAVG